MAITQITNNVILDNSILPVKMSISSALKTFLGNPTSSNFAATISDETGSGALVFASSPTLTTPFIAAINGGSAANNSITIQGTTNATRTTSYVLLQPNGGNVGIGTLTPNTTTILELSSTTRGFLPPRMTSTQRDAISGAAVPSGLTIFNSTDNALSLYTTVLSSWGNILTTHAGSFTSETLRNAVSDETGTGNLVFSDNPTFSGTVNITGNLSASGALSASSVTVAGNVNVSGGVSSQNISAGDIYSNGAKLAAETFAIAMAIAVG